MKYYIFDAPTCVRDESGFAAMRYETRRVVAVVLNEQEDRIEVEYSIFGEVMRRVVDTRDSGGIVCSYLTADCAMILARQRVEEVNYRLKQKYPMIFS